MAIEVIPKPKNKVIFAGTTVLYIITAVLIIFILSYFALIFLKNRADKNLAEIEKRLTRTEEESKLENQVSSAKRNLDNWSLLASEHRFPLAVFKLLQKNTHPKVSFSGFQFNLRENTLALEGQTENYETLGQQVLIFQNHNLIQKVNVSKISINPERRINFELKLFVDPQILK